MKIFKEYVFLFCLFDGMNKSKQVPKQCVSFKTWIIKVFMKPSISAKCTVLLQQLFRCERLSEQF